jgi:hypothetical protein
LSKFSSSKSISAGKLGARCDRHRRNVGDSGGYCTSLRRFTSIGALDDTTRASGCRYAHQDYSSAFLGVQMRYAFIAGGLVVLSLAFMIWARRTGRPEVLESEELQRRFPRKIRKHLIALIVGFFVGFIVMSLAGCGPICRPGAVFCSQGTGASGGSSALNAAQPISPVDPPPGDPTNPSPTTPLSIGTPSVIEAVGCTNRNVPPQQYAPFSCQLAQPIQAGDSIKAIFWENGSNTDITTTPKVTDANGTIYAPVAQFIPADFNNELIYVFSGVSSVASSSLNVTAAPVGTTDTIRSFILIHTRGGNNFKNYFTTSCPAVQVAPPSSQCLPIVGPFVTPAANDLLLGIVYSGNTGLPTCNNNTDTCINCQNCDGPLIQAPYLTATSTGDALGVGFFVAADRTPVQPTFNVDPIWLQQHAGLTSSGWTVMVASFF